MAFEPLDRHQPKRWQPESAAGPQGLAGPAGARRRGLVSAASLAILLLAGCDQLTPGGGSKPAFKAIDITGAEYARVLNLTDFNGQKRSLADFKGQVLVVFFGFTQCPDVCPTTMAELAEVKRSLGADGDRITGIFVSVDPERDTPELLKAYMANFGSDMVGLRGTPDEVRAAAKEFKVFYNRVPGKTDTSYTVDHTAGSYVLDAQGRIRLFTRYGSGAEALAHDLKILLAEKG